MVPGLPYRGFKREGYDVSIMYLRALRNNELRSLNTPRFLSRAIPLFLRSAYLGTRRPYLPIGQLRELDANLLRFFKRNIDRVHRVFNNRDRPFTTKFGRTLIMVRRGYVIVRHGDLRIISIIFPEDIR